MSEYHKRHRDAHRISKHVETYIQSQVLRRSFISAIGSLRPVARGIGKSRQETVWAEAKRLYERREEPQAQEPEA